MKKKRLPKPITILVLTLLTSFVWVGLNVYRTLTVKPPSPVHEDISKPLNPVLNTDVIQKIESALYIPDSEVPQINQLQVATPTPGAIPTPSAPTPTASASATPSEATASALPST